MKRTSQLFAFLCVLFFSGNTINSQSEARDLQDLVGIKGASAEMELQNRGYSHVKTDKSDYDVYSNWWNDYQKRCITYHLVDGRVRSVTNVPAYDCGRSDSNTSSRNQGNNDYNTAFERGRNDGMHNKSYNNVYADSQMKNAYTEGYNAGVNNRSGGSSHHSGGGHHQGMARTDDLTGLSVDRTIKTLKERGFKKLDHINIDGNKQRHRYFYNQSTGQCIETVARNETTLEVHNSSRCNK